MLSRQIAQPLDDLAVFVLFSIFEATVRDVVSASVGLEVDRLKHPALRSAVETTLETIRNGSFFRVLEFFKSDVTNDLIEGVNQVRRYRNWVAHGRRPDQPPRENVTPEMAYERLQEFLTVILPPVGI